MENFNKYRKTVGAVALVLLAIVLYIFFHQIVQYIYNSDSNLAAVLKSSKIFTATPTQPTTETEGIDLINPPVVRGPSCPTGSRLLWENMANEIDTRIANIGPSPTTRNLWLTRGDQNGGWQRNPNVWTSRGQTPIDLTGISPWNSQGGYQRAGTLISSRHIIMADHFLIPTGSTIIFVDNQNNVVSRQIVDTRRVGTSDIHVGLLNADVPSTIAYYPILDKYDLSGSPGNPSTYIKILSHRVPVLVLNQDDEAIVAETSSLRPDTTGINRQIPATGSQRNAFYESLITGDSGDATLAVINGRMAMLGAHLAVPVDSSNIYYHDLLDQPGTTDILEAVSVMSPGYNFPTFDLDCLERNIAPEFSRSSYNFTLNSNYTAGTVIGRVPATDSNNSGDVLFYRLSNTTPGQFSINQTNGDITILQSGLLTSANPSITFTANVDDDWVSFMSDTANVTVSLDTTQRPRLPQANAGDAEIIPPVGDTTPPVFGLSFYNFSIRGNLANGSSVGQVTATDNRDSELTYSITTGNAARIFSVGLHTGQITIARSNAPEYRAPASFLLTVRATDSSGNVGSTLALVNVTLGTPAGSVNQANNETLIVADNNGGGGDNNPPGDTPNPEDNGGGNNHGGGGGGGGSGGGSSSGGASNGLSSIPGLPTPPGPGASVPQQIAYLQEVVRILVIRLQAQIAQNGGSLSGDSTSISTCGDLTIGSTGSCVQTLQRYLNSHGFIVSATGAGSVGNETIYFGPATAQAVVRFQIAFGISPASGIFGPITRARMAEQP